MSQPPVREHPSDLSRPGPQTATGQRGQLLTTSPFLAFATADTIEDRPPRCTNYASEQPRWLRPAAPCPTHHLRETQSPRPMGAVWAHHLRKPSNYGSRPLEGRLAETPRPESVDRHLKGPSVRLGLPTCPPRPCRAAGLASGSVSPVSAPAPRPEFSNRSRLYARPASERLAPDPDSSADLPSALPDPASRSCSSTGLPHPAGNLAPPSPPLPSPTPTSAASASAACPAFPAFLSPLTGQQASSPHPLTWLAPSPGLPPRSACSRA